MDKLKTSLSAFGDWNVCWVSTHNDLVMVAATVVIALFTIALVLVSWCQARLISKQVRLAREEFRATHRPKIAIRACKLGGSDETGSHKWNCKFTYHNEGASTAYIREIGTRVFAWSKPHTYGDREIWFKVEAVTKILTSGEDAGAYSGQDFDCDDMERLWWFAGYVKYSDQKTGGTIRKVGFLRKWDGKPGLDLGDHEWVKEPNDEYEYSY